MTKSWSKLDKRTIKETNLSFKNKLIVVFENDSEKPLFLFTEYPVYNRGKAKPSSFSNLMIINYNLVYDNPRPRDFLLIHFMTELSIFNSPVNSIHASSLTLEVLNKNIYLTHGYDFNYKGVYMLNTNWRVLLCGSSEYLRIMMIIEKANLG